MLVLSNKIHYKSYINNNNIVSNINNTCKLDTPQLDLKPQHSAPTHTHRNLSTVTPLTPGSGDPPRTSTGFSACTPPTSLFLIPPWRAQPAL